MVFGSKERQLYARGKLDLLGAVIGGKKSSHSSGWVGHMAIYIKGVLFKNVVLLFVEMRGRDKHSSTTLWRSISVLIFLASCS